MIRHVVDTNVAVVSNGRNTNACAACREASIDALAQILEGGQIVIDTAGEMLDEYRRYCSPKGEPGVGDRFFREVLMNYSGKVLRVELPKRVSGGYVDFPEEDPGLAAFDPSDRKFAAAARKAGAEVLNATDDHWLSYRAQLLVHGIAVKFLCGCVRQLWFAQE